MFTMMPRWVTATTFIFSLFVVVDGFTSLPKPVTQRAKYLQQVQRPPLEVSKTTSGDFFKISESNVLVHRSRRQYLIESIAMLIVATQARLENANAEESSTLDGVLQQIQKARQQMNDVPDLIKKEQWDSVRAILITPPLSDLWTKSARKSPLLQEYANLVGDIPSGDELAVLEAKEDVEGHLRFLDMAVYNNVFNPVKSVGESGVTKELVRSYYEDPINEYKATVAALDNLIQLGNVK
jgi:hypothetical protein